MPQITVAAIQMACSADPAQNIAHAEELVRQAAVKGAQIVLLPELFERPYFCQERRYEYYSYAMERFWAFTARRIFRTTIIIRKSFILRRAIQVSRCLIPSMAKSASEFAGTSGSRKRHAALRWQEQISSCIQQQLGANRFWTWTAQATGKEPCRGMQRPILYRWQRQTAMGQRWLHRAGKMAGSKVHCGFTGPAF